MLSYASWEMPLKWTFHCDNDPTHSSKLAKDQLTIEKLDCMSWPAQSPDRNPIENLWGDVKRSAAATNPSSRAQLSQVFQEAWAPNSFEALPGLIEYISRRCKALINNKGSTTKYLTLRYMKIM